jgi:hypothetical protein
MRLAPRIALPTQLQDQLLILRGDFRGGSLAGAARVLAQPLLVVSLEAPPPLPESRVGKAAAAADEAGVLSAGVESNPGEARLNPLLNVVHAQLSIETMLVIPTIQHPAKGSSSRDSTRVTRGARTPAARAASRSSAPRNWRRSPGVSLFTSSRIRSSVAEGMTQAPQLRSLIANEHIMLRTLDTLRASVQGHISKSARRRPLSTARQWLPRGPARRCGRSPRASKESRAGASKVPSVHTSSAASQVSLDSIGACGQAC